jgi:hypothetical protein
MAIKNDVTFSVPEMISMCLQTFLLAKEYFFYCFMTETEKQVVNGKTM